MANTREKILECAQSIANRDGLASLSIRTVADELGLSPGNVSYYFSKKQDLVLALAEPLSAGNRERFLQAKVESVSDFFNVYRGIFEHQHRYRGLVLALPYVVNTFPKVGRGYSGVEKERAKQQKRILVMLVESGDLNATDADLDRLVAHLTFIGRFWLAEARTSFAKESLARVLDHYLAMIADLFMPFATDKSRGALERQRKKMIKPA